ncbi:hypothetical protein GWK36_09625 [Caldichromatium japonicum]|uniref:Uncharacterized protein n=1 Tax=Caldichromatium japonicum TaxID=2699430 RepID=A0A6G7VDP3_9GAMM|nr:hypothetical protein [Caldichromatium japonicum]QIK38193.1 hypothetical protein GWK36_09625 [Caldichromatium japonicum]
MAHQTVFSFAIFETLLTQRTATVVGVFCAMRQTLHLHPIPGLPIQLIEEFPEIRIWAEQSARYPQPGDARLPAAAGLDAIYGRIAERYGLDPEQTAALRSREYATTQALLVAIPETIGRVRQLLNAGERVVLVSDSRFSAAELRSLLSCIDARLAACPCYASVDLGLTKASGALFRAVFEAEGIAPSQLIHCGNDPWSDVKVPRALGCVAEHYAGAALSELEWAYLEESHLFYQLVAGTAKVYRLYHPGSSAPGRLGAGLAAPLFYGFICQVLDEALRRGIRRLYFVARDGMIFLRLAQAIARARGLDLELRYLYGSRRAFRLPSVFELGLREYRWLTERIPTLSLAMLAERLEMRPSELFEQLPPELQAQLPDLDASLPEPLTTQLVQSFAQIPALRSAILAKAAQARALVIAYLEQEGFFDGGPVGTVDIGWMGSSQDALYKIAASHRPDIEIHGFYFGLFHYSLYTSQRNRKTPYAIRPNQVSENIVALHTELLAQADHGQTMGYERASDGRIRPRLRDDGGHLRAWGISEFLEAAEWFAAEYAHFAGRYPLLVEHFDAVVPRLLDLMRRPSRLLAETLGRIPYSGDHCDLILRESAPAFGWREALAYTFGRRYEERRLMTEWYEATLVRSPPLARLILHLQPRVQALKVLIKHSLLALRQAPRLASARLRARWQTWAILRRIRQGRA